MFDRSGSSRRGPGGRRVGVEGGELASPRLSVVTHHHNNGFNSGLPSILRAAATVLAVKRRRRRRGRRGSREGV